MSRTGSGDNSNEEILREIASLRGYVDSNLSRFVTTEYLDQRIERLGFNVMATLSSQLQAMMRDAMSSAVKEEMHTVQTEFQRMQDEYAEMTRSAITEDRIVKIIDGWQERERLERREQFQKVFNYMKVGVPTIVGFMTMVNLVGNWLGWF